MATSALGLLTWIESSLTPVAPCKAWLSMAGLTWARKGASKWARTCAPDMGRWATAAMSHRSWAPARVSGGMTAFAGPAEAAAVVGPGGVGVPGELHAAAKSATAAISTRNGHAGRARLPLLRLQSPGIHFPPAASTVAAATGPEPLVPAESARPIPVAGPVR